KGLFRVDQKDDGTPDPAGALVLKKFREAQKAAAAPGEHPELLPVCRVKQLVDPTVLDANGSCENSTAAGWCYATGAAAGRCSQEILFSPSGNPQVGAQVSLQCIEQQVAAGNVDGGGGNANVCK